MSEAQAIVRVEAVEPFPPRIGPELSNGSVVYVPSSRRTIVRAAREEKRRLATLPLAPRPSGVTPVDGPRADLELAAGDDAIAVQVRTEYGALRDPAPKPKFVQSFAGPAAGPLTARSPVCSAEAAPPVIGVAAAGARVALLGPECGDRSLVDVRSGERRALPPDAFSVQLAGHFVGWLETAGPDSTVPGVTIVVTTADGAEVSRVSAPQAPANAAILALDDDGTAALVSQPVGGRRGAYTVLVRAGGRDLERVAVPADAFVISARMSGGRLAVLTALGQVLLFDAANPARAPSVLPGAVPAYEEQGLSIDRERIALLSRRCASIAVVTIGLGELPKDVSRTRRCALRLVRAPRVSPTGLRVALSCRGFLPSCGPAALTVRLGGPAGRVVARRTRAPFSTPGGALTVRLPASARRALRRARRVHLSVAIADVAGSPDRRFRRAGTFRLARSRTG